MSLTLKGTGKLSSMIHNEVTLLLDKHGTDEDKIKYEILW